MRKRSSIPMPMAIVALLLLMIMPALQGCYQNDVAVVKVPTAAQIAVFNTHANITLPASAKPTRWMQQQGLDDAMWMQIEIPTKDVRAFLDNSPFRNSTLSKDAPLRLHDFSLWVAKAPLKYQAGQSALANAQVLNILIDQSDDQTAIIYLMWHQT
jgi:hypothetical protein